MTDLPLPPEQEAEAQVVFQRLKSAFGREARQLARLMASKDDRQVLGRTEFEVREPVHRLGAQVLGECVTFDFGHFWTAGGASIL